MFEKIKNLRGALYRKVVEPKKEEKLDLPGFQIQRPQRIPELLELKDITKMDVTYSILEPFTYANVKWNTNTKELEYLVIEPKLSEDDVNLLKKISDFLIELVEVKLTAIQDTGKAVEYLQQQVNKIIKETGLVLDQNQYVKIIYYIYKNFVGYNEIEPFLQDPNIEDISCDGTETPIYIIHRKFGSLKTNVSFEDPVLLREFIVKLAERSGRYVSYAEPILDGTLPDGSRVSATLANDVATRGPTFTIRKFSEKPFSPSEQIDLGTADSEIFAYFWYMIEHGASILVVGGVSTGKTSFLNSVSMFIPPELKVISIEDTREIRIPHQHWIASLARGGFGIPTPSGAKYGEVTLFDLLKESFRQNPDYVIVGEVRGNETYVMFQGMSSGHPSMSTFHAGSIDTMIKRMITPPIELSPTLLESLDIVAVMVHAREKGKSARRIKEIAEIVSVDPKTDEVKTNVIFRWDPVTDTYVKVNDSMKLEKFATAKGGTLEDAVLEVQRRKRILDWLHSQGPKDYVEFSQRINSYYKEPKAMLKIIGEEEIPELTRPRVAVPTPAPVPKAVEKAREQGEGSKKRTSILELLGFKLIRER